MKKIGKLLIVFVLLTTTLAGCTKTSESNEKEVEETIDNSEEEWPRIITDSLGEEITLEKKPERIALLDFGYLETLLALGVTPIASTFVERSLNGFGTLQPYADTVEIEELGENKAPNLEKLVELEPDLILYTAESRNLDKELYESASQIAPVAAYDISDWKEQLRAFGECLGKEEEAEKYISEVEALIADSKEKLEDTSDKTVAILFERSSDVGNFLIIASGDNPVWFDAADGLGLTPPEGYPETGEKIVSMEGLAELDPDYIFLCGALGTEANGYEQSYLSEETKASSVWQSLNAVKNGKVYNLDAAVRAAGPLSIKLGVETIVESMSQ